MRHLIVFCYIVIFWLVSCNINNQTVNSKNQDVLILNKDSVAKIDSIKWVYYYLNYHGDALFYDSNTKKRISLNPLECEIELDWYQKLKNDSVLYIFSLTKPNYSFLYIEGVAYSNQFIVTKSFIYPQFAHIRFDFQNHSDSLSAYLKKSDNEFRGYLKKYSGKIPSWLKQEAIRRNVY
jgi:hypothetical protein